jgi:hypothetical protein
MVRAWLPATGKHWNGDRKPNPWMIAPPGELDDLNGNVERPERVLF